MTDYQRRNVRKRKPCNSYQCWLRNQKNKDLLVDSGKESSRGDDVNKNPDRDPTWIRLSQVDLISLAEGCLYQAIVG